MNIFSDVDSNKIKIFHKNGKVEIPKLKNKDTLLLELQEFADCCKKKKSSIEIDQNISKVRARGNRTTLLNLIFF